MKFLFVAVGKLKEDWAKLACEEYKKRLSAYGRVEIIEVKQAEDLPKQVPPRYAVWKLDEHGEEMTSVQLAKQMENVQNRSFPGICFLLGGPDGFGNLAGISIHLVWSLSLLTFPYQLARVITLEQMYRACSILQGEPYHRI